MESTEKKVWIFPLIWDPLYLENKLIPNPVMLCTPLTYLGPNDEVPLLHTLCVIVDYIHPITLLAHITKEVPTFVFVKCAYYYQL